LQFKVMGGVDGFSFRSLSCILTLNS